LAKPKAAAPAAMEFLWSSLPPRARNMALSKAENTANPAPPLPATRGKFVRTARMPPARRPSLGEFLKPLMKWKAEPNDPPTKKAVAHVVHDAIAVVRDVSVHRHQGFD
jgi:hypothetical protein